jgi:DNA-binding NarL/FixJ family response regulator
MASIRGLSAESEPREIELLIADDSPRARDALRAMLTVESRCRVVGEADDGQHALRLVGQHRPHVVVADVRMSGLDGIRLTQEIKRRWPGIRVVILTMHPGYEGAALMAGADAFLVKGAAPASILRAVLGDL